MTQHHDLDALMASWSRVSTAPHGPRRDALMTRFLRLVEPILEEREQLIQGLLAACDTITERRESLGSSMAYPYPEPADEAYQKGVTKWLSWLHRYEAIETTLGQCRESGVLKS